MRSFPTRFATVFLVAVASFAGFFAPSARGDIVVQYADVGSDLQFSWSGSLPFTPSSSATPGTTASITSNSSLSTPQSLYAFNGYKFQNMNSDRTPSGTGLFAITNFGAKSGTRTGDTFGLSFPTSQAGNTSVFLPSDYTANTPISGTLTIPNFSVASAGLSDVSFALGNSGSLGVISFQAVPEPSAVALCGAAAAGLGFAGVRRRWKDSPAKGASSTISERMSGS